MPILPHVFGDHPRGCGAHYGTRKRTRCLLGSSPRVRGSHLRQGKDDSRLGIIPAGAGLTQCRHGGRRGWRDHPRGCGAHRAVLMSWRDLQGSSPRVRGSLASDLTSRSPHGIIPAGAGLTRPYAFPNNSPWDHPRGCGAHYIFEDEDLIYQGSSPRVRGSLKTDNGLNEGAGIIPAGAGLTPCFF